jgi:tRNA dimethylallyltransferase
MVAQQVTLLAIVGPTASGKTVFAVSLAKQLNGEIISADSRTVYRGLDIGTAKPTTFEQDGVTHWGFDLIDPDSTFSAAQFKAYASAAIKDIVSRGKLPILVGGTGLYIDSVLYDFSFIEPNRVLRDKYQKHTIVELQDFIREAGLAMPINNQNKRHLIAVLERQGEVAQRKPLPRGVLILGINPGRDVLESRMALRAKEMFDLGVAIEFNNAVEHYGVDAPGLTGGIYRILAQFGANLDVSKAKNEFVKSDMRLAKRQITWFKRNKDIHWFDSADSANAWLKIEKLVH